MGCKSSHDVSTERPSDISSPRIHFPVSPFKSTCPHDKFYESFMILGNGNTRNVVHWLPTSNHVKAIVFIAHGLHEHAVLYDKLAHSLTEREFACFSMDYACHGLSEGTKGTITDNKSLCYDFLALIDLIQSTARFSKLPVFIYGHSIGALVTLMIMNEVKHMVSAVFSGSLLYPGDKFISKSSLMRTLSSSVDPTGKAGQIIMTEVTSEENNTNLLVQDERIYHGVITNKTAREVLQLIDAVKLQLSIVKIPFLAIHGKSDCIALKEGSQYIYDNAGTDKQKKSFICLDNCKHHPYLENTTTSSDFIVQVCNYFESFLMARLQLNHVNVSV